MKLKIEPRELGGRSRILGILFLIFFQFVIFNSESSILYSQWVQSDSIGVVNSIIASGNNIFAGVGGYYGVYISTNNGINWTQTSLKNQDVWSIAASGNNVYAGTVITGVYLSNDNGLSWIQTSLNHEWVMSLAASGDNVFAGTQIHGIYLSTNKGLNWTQTTLNHQTVFSLIINENNFFAGTLDYGVYKSTDKGLNWILTSLTHQAALSFTFMGNNIFTGTYHGVCLSTNNGVDWTQTSLNHKTVSSFAISGQNIFAGTGSSGAYFSTNNGMDWVQCNVGFPDNISIRSFCIINNYIIAGTWPAGIWRRYIPELIETGKKSNEKPPTEFKLFQSYPGPSSFPVRIKYEIADSCFVTLKVYDIIGNDVETLVNTQLKPGYYEAIWEGKDQPSGVYFYKLQATIKDEIKFSDTKKVVVVK